MKNILTSSEINALLEKQRETGGKVYLEAGCHSIQSPLIMDTPSQKLCGEVWAYNLDPNGVFETEFGTKLRLVGKDHPAIKSVQAARLLLLFATFSFKKRKLRQNISP